MPVPLYNTDFALYEFKLRGEYQLQEKLRSIEMHSIFDVGCNIGEWTKMTRAFQPVSLIHMFEVSPFTFQKMLRNVYLDNGIFANSYGLSDGVKEIEFKIVTDNDRVSTAVLNITHDNAVIKNALVATGDFYMRHYGIPYIDFLKIDTEGHEYSVLEGFLPQLQQGIIGCIQFEFGYINVLTKKLLIDFYQLLVPYGYVIGKLTPDGVSFTDYKLFHEDFSGSDYVAVHQSRTDMIDLIRSSV